MTSPEQNLSHSLSVPWVPAKCMARETISVTEGIAAAASVCHVCQAVLSLNILFLNKLFKSYSFLKLVLTNLRH